MPAPFDEIEIGQVVYLGEVRVDARALEAFIAAFAPGWPAERGAPDAMVFAIWTRLDSASVVNWPQTKRLGVGFPESACIVSGVMNSPAA